MGRKTPAKQPTIVDMTAAVSSFVSGQKTGELPAMGDSSEAEEPSHSSSTSVQDRFVPSTNLGERMCDLSLRRTNVVEERP